jgi:hypothetical protein
MGCYVAHDILRVRAARPAVRNEDDMHRATHQHARHIQICPWCQRPTQAIWVHGHGQCMHCRTNIDPCCGGDEIIPSGGDPENPRVLRPMRPAA